MSKKLMAAALVLGVSMLPVAAIAGGWGGGGGGDRAAAMATGRCATSLKTHA